MQTILIAGAGKSSVYLIHYLLTHAPRNKWKVVVADGDANAILEKLNGNPYGEAAAIDVFGVADSLPRATSGEDQYYLWGPPSDDTRDVIVVNGDPNQWRGRCGGVEQAGEFGAPLAMPYERQRPILICHDLRQPLSAIWRDLKYVHRKIDSATARDGESEGAAP